MEEKSGFLYLFYIFNVFIFNLIAQQIITSSRRRISIYSRIISDSSNNRLEIDADTYYTINNNKNELW